jgi:hypothetical protein
MAPELPFQRISNVLEKVLPSYGLTARMAEWSLKLKWEGIVGKPVAAHTEPVQLTFRNLVVMVDSPAWLQHLTFLKAELTEKIQRACGRETVAEIRFRVGSLSRDSSSRVFTAPPHPLPTCLSEDEVILIEEYLRPLQDPTLKEKLRSLITRSFLG